ncbi:hypothetical protein T484DRAFT_1989859 [Baffinella frigidus]|nr:hypothetical protein T484DRAFT_1989859 [Cryptophyta sp. CCMP2293]
MAGAPLPVNGSRKRLARWNHIGPVHTLLPTARPARGADDDRQLDSGFGAEADRQPVPGAPKPTLAPGCIPSLLPVHVLLRACFDVPRTGMLRCSCVRSRFLKKTSDFLIAQLLCTLGSRLAATSPCSL